MASLGYAQTITVGEVSISTADNADSLDSKPSEFYLDRTNHTGDTIFFRFRYHFTY